MRASTRVMQHVRAPREKVYRALLDADAVATWMVPGAMTSTATFTLSDANGGTDVVGVHQNLPPGLSPADNETGWRMSLAKLASFLEQHTL